MQVIPSLAEATRSGVWYTGSSTIGELFGASGGNLIDVNYTITDLVQLSDAWSM